MSDEIAAAAAADPELILPPISVAEALLSSIRPLDKNPAPAEPADELSQLQSMAEVTALLLEGITTAADDDFRNKCWCWLLIIPPPSTVVVMMAAAAAAAAVADELPLNRQLNYAKRNKEIGISKSSENGYQNRVWVKLKFF